MVYFFGGGEEVFENNFWGSFFNHVNLHCFIRNITRNKLSKTLCGHMSQQQAHEKAEQIKTLQMIINKMQIKNKN